MASPKILEIKKEAVKSLASEFTSAETMVVADHRGLTVAEDTELRAALREANVTYKVIKNNIAQLAAKSINLDDLEDVFKGPSAIAYSETDPIAPARVIYKFVKQFEALELKGGKFEGRVASKEELIELANIPDTNVLYTKLVGSLCSPITGLAMIIDAIAKKLESESPEPVEEAPVAQVEEAKEEVKEEVKAEEAPEAKEEVKAEEVTEVKTEEKEEAEKTEE